MNVEKLYFDESFTSFLLWLANKNIVDEFDDFRQEVFAEIIERDCDSLADCKRAANRIVKRISRNALRPDGDLDISMLAYNRHTEDEEPQDEVMSRLIYHGKARKVG